MAEWARANLSDFYKIYAKLVPQEVNAEVHGDVTLNVITGVPKPDA